MPYEAGQRFRNYGLRWYKCNRAGCRRTKHVTGYVNPPRGHSLPTCRCGAPNMQPCGRGDYGYPGRIIPASRRGRYTA